MWTFASQHNMRRTTERTFHIKIWSPPTAAVTRTPLNSMWHPCRVGLRCLLHGRVRVFNDGKGRGEDTQTRTLFIECQRSKGAAFYCCFIHTIQCMRTCWDLHLNVLGDILYICILSFRHLLWPFKLCLLQPLYRKSTPLPPPGGRMSQWSNFRPQPALLVPYFNWPGFVPLLCCNEKVRGASRRKNPVSFALQQFPHPKTGSPLQELLFEAEQK